MGDQNITMEQFAEAAARQVGSLLGEGYTVEKKSVTKNNGVRRTALMIQEGESDIVPLIYLDGLYQGFLEGMALDEACGRIVRSYQEDTLHGDIGISGLEQFDSVEGRLYCRLLNAERNAQMLERVPHKLFHDLALAAYISFADDRMGEGTVTVGREQLGAWGIDEDTLLRHALRNTPKLGQSAVPMAEALEEMSGISVPEGEQPEAPGLQLYVASNDRRCYGAAVMLDGGFLRRFSDRIGGRSFYILPSSVHELLFLPEGVVPAEELRRMVREVNEREVPPEEVLSDNVYYYDRASGRVEVA